MTTAQPPAPRLTALLRLGGAVAVSAGVHTALAGTRAVPGYAGPREARLDSEIRFFGPFYAAYGLALWRAAAEPERARPLLGVLFAAGLARAYGWQRAGRPSKQQLGLLAIELVAPPVVDAAIRR